MNNELVITGGYVMPLLILALTFYVAQLRGRINQLERSLDKERLGHVLGSECLKAYNAGARDALKMREEMIANTNFNN